MNLKPVAHEHGPDLREGRHASSHATPLPERRCEYAQRQHTYAATVQTEGSVDMRSIDIVSVAAENIGPFVAGGPDKPLPRH
ncbi:hypothetical protein [Burkholderia cepacia]|uniref:hypothetical protein n=1 Tax=Burkholderia cepacia TaxID=292 RepID=UPI00115F7F47|nr:hypothetical protein [Burkholderia cepacia]